MLRGEAYPDPYLELLRVGVEHREVTEAVVVTLAVDGALVTGTVIPAGTWEDLYFRQVAEADYYGMRKVVREVFGHLDQAVEDGRRRRGADPRFLHLKDVTVRSGRTARKLPAWRGPLAAVSGWSLGGPDER
ncbi:hypothetical protein [Streptomyces sp. CBMA156]|uniref:hypothetical protein n=1 Tax=Streptomyces sp. CBMA156 TaxID=1930280 RepID=UPI001661CA40|nr:hypothetical protein [Streptomyces sp. CBMA156]